MFRSFPRPAYAQGFGGLGLSPPKLQRRRKAGIQFVAFGPLDPCGDERDEVDSITSEHALARDFRQALAQDRSVDDDRVALAAARQTGRQRARSAGEPHANKQDNALTFVTRKVVGADRARLPWRSPLDANGFAIRLSLALPVRTKAEICLLVRTPEHQSSDRRSKKYERQRNRQDLASPRRQPSHENCWYG
jgi:hypothetical protein